MPLGAFFDWLSGAEMERLHERVHTPAIALTRLLAHHDGNISDEIRMVAHCSTTEMIEKLPEGVTVTTTTLAQLMRIAWLMGYKAHEMELSGEFILPDEPAS